jgi:hypothetical protein
MSNTVKTIKPNACPQCGNDLVIIVSSAHDSRYSDQQGYIHIELYCNAPATSSCTYNPILSVSLYDLLRKAKAISAPNALNPIYRKEI